MKPVSGSLAALALLLSACGDDAPIVEASETPGVNDAPSIAVTQPALSVVSATSITFTGANAITLADPDAGEAAITLSITASSGTLHVPATDGVTVMSPAPAFAATGTISALNAALATTTWHADHNFVGDVTLTFLADDLGNTGTGGELTATVVVTITVALDSDAPTAGDDNYVVNGNTELVVAAPGVLTNDTDPEGALTAVAASLTSALGGKVEMAADGAFTYRPPVGIGDATTRVEDSFAYTVRDTDGNERTGMSHVSLGQVIWYVDSARATAGATGASHAPFATVVEADNAASTNAVIYLVDGGTSYGDFSLTRSGTLLVGSGAQLLLDGGASLPATTSPTTGQITATADCTLRGIDIETASRGVSFTGAGGFTVEGVTISGGPSVGISIDSSTGPAIVTIANVTIDAAAVGVAATGTHGGLVMDIDALTVEDADQGLSYSAGADDGLGNYLFVRNSVFRRVNGCVSIQADGIPSMNYAVRDNTFETVGAYAIAHETDDVTNGTIALIADNVVTNAPSDAVFSISQTTSRLDLTMSGNQLASGSNGLDYIQQAGGACLNLRTNDFGDSVALRNGSDTTGTFVSGTIELYNYADQGLAPFLSDQGNHVDTVSVDPDQIFVWGLCATLEFTSL